MPRIVFALIVCALIGLAPQGAVSAGEEVFRVSTSYKSLLSTPEQTGMLDRLIKEAFRRIGLRAEIVFTPTGRSLPDVDAGLLDAEINRIEGMERTFPDGWESIRNLHIGIVRGWKILEENTRGFPNVILVPTETELFTMLDKGRIDVALYDKLTGYETVARLNFPEIRHLEPPLVSRDMFLYVHTKNAGLVEEIAGALREMKRDGTYDIIVSETTAHLPPDAR